MENCNFCGKIKKNLALTAESKNICQECAQKDNIFFCADCQLPSKKTTNCLCDSCYKEAICSSCGKFMQDWGYSPCEHCGCQK